MDGWIPGPWQSGTPPAQKYEPEIQEFVAASLLDEAERAREEAEEKLGQLKPIAEKLDVAVKEASHGLTANPVVIDAIVLAARDSLLALLERDQEPVPPNKRENLNG